MTTKKTEPEPVRVLAKLDKSLDPDDKVRLAVWIISFIGVCALVAHKDIPASTIEYLLFWAAGTLGGKFTPKKEDKGEQ